MGSGAESIPDCDSKRESERDQRRRTERRSERQKREREGAEEAIIELLRDHRIVDGNNERKHCGRAFASS